MELWTAEQYAAAAGLPLRTAQWRLRRWYATGRVRVVREQLPATGDAPPRARYLLDMADWRRAAGVTADDHDDATSPQGQDQPRPGRAA